MYQYLQYNFIQIRLNYLLTMGNKNLSKSIQVVSRISLQILEVLRLVIYTVLLIQRK